MVKATARAAQTKVPAVTWMIAAITAVPAPTVANKRHQGRCASVHPVNP